MRMGGTLPRALPASNGPGTVAAMTTTKPMRSGIITASVLLAEVADVLRAPREADDSVRWWLVDEYCDNEGETIGLAFEASPEVDAAMLAWARSFDQLVAADEGREPHEDPVGRRLGLTFRCDLTTSAVEALAELGDDNDYGSRVRYISPAGAQLVVEAAKALEPGESLSLYKGKMSTCYSDEDERKPRDIGDLWRHDSDIQGEREEASETSEDDIDAALQDKRDEEDAADHEDFARRTDPPARAGTLSAAYWAAGYGLGVQVDGSTTHLLRSEASAHRGEGGTVCGDLVKVEFIMPLSDALDFPEHPRLCGRCCATANDRASV